MTLKCFFFPPRRSCETLNASIPRSQVSLLRPGNRKEPEKTSNQLFGISSACQWASLISTKSTFQKQESKSVFMGDLSTLRTDFYFWSTEAKHRRRENKRPKTFVGFQLLVATKLETFDESWGRFPTMLAATEAHIFNRTSGTLSSWINVTRN